MKNLRVIFFSALLMGGFATSLAAAATSALPKTFVDKGACPFECCTYREWSVGKDTTLYDKPNGTQVVGRVKKGEKVTGLTGIIYIAPTPMQVVYPHLPYKKGETVYLLTPIGEGFRKVWFNGKVREEEVVFLYNYGADKTCKKPDKECWGRVQGEDNEGKMTWWVQVKLPNGKSGWSKESANFGNMDSCG